MDAYSRPHRLLCMALAPFGPDIHAPVETSDYSCTVLALIDEYDSHVVNAFQVIQVCQAVNRNMRIFRARFSALIPRELQRAMQQLVQPNAADSAAVDARQEIDLRIGASFTRFQTLLLQVIAADIGVL